MKRLIPLFALFSTFCGALMAEEYSCQNACCVEDSNRLYLGPKVYYANLSVQNTDSTIGGLIGLQNETSHIHGVMWGANGGYEYKARCGLYANIDLNYGQGDLKHNDNFSRYLHEFDAAAVLGYTLGSTLWSITGYAGLGYLTQNYSIEHLDVKYRYYIYHVPVGIKCDYVFTVFCSNWSIGLDAAALPQADSTVKINRLKGARWNLAKRCDWAVKIPLQYYSACWPLSLKLDLFWKRTGTGGSKAVSPSGVALGLPPTRLNAYGASFDLAYDF